MPRVSSFHSVNEIKKLPERRVFHFNTACQLGDDIPVFDRKSGDGGYFPCDDCEKLNREGK